MYYNLSFSSISSTVMFYFPLSTFLYFHSACLGRVRSLPPTRVSPAPAPAASRAADRKDRAVGRLGHRSVSSTLFFPQPPGPPDTTLTLAPLCVDCLGDLAMRLRNTGDSTRHVQWDDLTSGDFGNFDVPPHSYSFFNVLRVSCKLDPIFSGSTTLQTNCTYHSFIVNHRASRHLCYSPPRPVL